ncbi:MAG: polysaccharide biosynthesis protein [Lysinibacillus sp.]
MASNYSMKTFMRGALLLTVAAILAKLLSAIYRIPFQNMVGDKGFYVFQQVYPFASIFVVLASSGFAVAISKLLIDEQQLQKRQQMKRAIFSYLMLLGLLFFTVLFIGAPIFSSWMGDEQLTALIRVAALVPLTLPFIAILKGGYQADNDMQTIAYAQLIEQFTRVVIILGGTLIVMVTTKSIYTAGTVAILGIVIGSFSSLLYLIFSKRQVNRFKLSQLLWDWEIVKKITKYSVSISMSSLVVILFQFIDSFTVFNGLLQNGVGLETAKATKGIYDRGQSLVQFSMVFVSALAMAIVPMIAYKSQKGDRREVPYVQLTYRVTLMMSAAATVGLVLVLPYANEMLFETDALSGMLSVYILQIIPLCFVLTFTAVLQGYGKLLWPTLFIVLAVVLKMVFNPFFIQIGGVYGASVANNVSLVVAAVCFIVYIKKARQVQLAQFKYYLKLTIALVSMIVVVTLLKWLLPEFDGRIGAALLTFVFILSGAGTFVLVVAKLRVLAEREWFLLPFGRRVAALQLILNQKK